MKNNTPKSQKKMILEIAGYVSIFICALILFTFLKIPEDKIAQKVTSEITRMSKGKAEIATFRYKIPFSGHIETLAYNIPTLDGEEGRLVFRNIRVGMPWYSLFTGNTRFKGSSEFSSGLIKAEGTLIEENEIQWKANGTDISLDFLDNLLTPASFQGEIQLQAEGIASGKTLKSATGEITIGTTDIRNLKIRELTLEKILLDSTHAELEAANDVITIKNLEIKGNELDIIVAGTITLRKRLEMSLLDLHAKLRVGPAFFKEMNLPLMTGLMATQQNKWLTIPIKGTIGKPRADFGAVLMNSPISKF